MTAPQKQVTHAQQQTTEPPKPTSDSTPYAPLTTSQEPAPTTPQALEPMENQTTLNTTTTNSQPTSPHKSPSKPTTSNTSMTKSPTIKTTAPKILIPNFAASSSLSPNSFKFTATPTSTINNPSLNVEMSDGTNSKRKKEHSPTDAKQSTKNLKTQKSGYNSKRCRFCTQKYKSIEDRQEHEVSAHQELLMCHICNSECGYMDISQHYKEYHPDETTYICHHCRICLPLKGMKVHTKNHHP
ncbi:uncharacterized protein DDB_G0284459-like [Physella acuta]|uniref:uncharacterized protein DDB_G0284459-like n=1 Tax=Physella acuta TaxID=109671 RepID=UPI0027DE48C9|nr:uncharacterized protein DDB_G0284459-like [Physella acuta]